MSSEWETKKLGEFIELKRGYDLPKAKRRLGNTPLVSSSGVSDTHDKPMVKGPGVVTGRYGTIGEVFYVRQDFWPLNTTLYVRDFKGNHPEFIHYFLKTLNFHTYSDKAAVPGVNRNHLHEALVCMPSVNEQKKIAYFLSALDSRITLLRETNQTLESIAQAIFKSWFVDFDPVRAKMEGRQPEGMDEETAALFPDSFEVSELGLAPKGWMIGMLGDVMLLHKGSVNPGSAPNIEFQHYSLPAYDSAQLPIVELGSEIKSNKTVVPEDAVLLSKLNPHIPRVWLPSKVEQNAVCSTEFLPLKPKNGSTAAFIYSWLSSPKLIAELSQLVTGTSNSHQRIRPDSLLSMKAVIPTNGLMNAFNSIAKALFEGVKTNRLTIQSLANLRDTLLPRLISGQLRLPEAQEEVKDALS